MPCESAGCHGGRPAPREVVRGGLEALPGHERA